jgi:hypothetical protein
MTIMMLILLLMLWFTGVCLRNADKDFERDSVQSMWAQNSPQPSRKSSLSAVLLPQQVLRAHEKGWQDNRAAKLATAPILMTCQSGTEINHLWNKTMHVKTWVDSHTHLLPPPLWGWRQGHGGEHMIWHENIDSSPCLQHSFCGISSPLTPLASQHWL